MSRRTSAPKVGGQALSDGVLMRAGEVWAVARLDGSLEMGRLPANRWVAVPLLRVLTGLGPALVRGLKAMGASGRNRTLPRRVRWALPLFLAAPLLLNAALSRFLGASTVWGWQTGLTAVLMVGVQLAALRVVMPGAMWRFHGAEHKAVAAYEQGIDLDDIDAVLGTSRVHDRCGTNVVAVLIAGCLLPLPSSGVLSVVTFLVVFAGSVEIVSLAARRPKAFLSRVVLAGGHFLQRYVTTAEPTREEQAVGVKALQTCLAMLAAERMAETALDELEAA
ncbi:MAG TPA: DUF1385 domain-containing protein [Frankiaceae bacterium]|nr:DUF1385 domain-containing protein [Frankiaceae bacterium]